MIALLAQTPSTLAVPLVYLVVIAVPVLVSVLKGVLDIIGFFRRSPVLEAQFATKAELTHVEQRLKQHLDDQIVRSGERYRELKKSICGVSDEIKESNETMAKMHADVSRALGKLEGRTTLG